MFALLRSPLTQTNELWKRLQKLDGLIARGIRGAKPLG
jgi:hypothetical protein